MGYFSIPTNQQSAGLGQSLNPYAMPVQTQPVNPIKAVQPSNKGEGYHHDTDNPNAQHGGEGAPEKEARWLEGKNLLHTGLLSPEDVALLLQTAQQLKINAPSIAALLALPKQSLFRLKTEGGLSIWVNTPGSRPTCFCHFQEQDVARLYQAIVQDQGEDGFVQDCHG
jgi:hypothetical protein